MTIASSVQKLARPAALLAAGVVAAIAIGVAGWPGNGPAATVQAQSACAPIAAGAAAENQQAFVDVGVGNTASFVCISSSSFPSGRSAPIAANGSVADGCYFVEGLGTSVVAVFRESPAIKTCPDLVRIDVGTSAPNPTATATATATSTATATATSTATATATATPTASPTGTATQPTATATQPTATSTATPPRTGTATPSATMPMPKPPTTGSGAASGGSSNVPLILGGLLLAAALGTTAAAATVRHKR